MVLNSDFHMFGGWRYTVTLIKRVSTHETVQKNDRLHPVSPEKCHELQWLGSRDMNLCYEILFAGENRITTAASRKQLHCAD